PQVWAWRPGRARKYGQVIDMMAVIFPFETPYYQEHDIPVCYVGHPSVDKVEPLRSRSEDRRLFALPEESPVVGILPGSRAQEIRRMLPVMLLAAGEVRKTFPGCRFLLPQADSISDELLQTVLQDSPVSVQVVRNQPYDVIQCCDAVMITSGTATLETALLTVPMVIVYKLSPLTYWLGRWLVKSPFIGLPNIVADKAIVRELIQQQASP
ncbi:lipid-A-disaccharide synthase, partial [Thiolapillus sp.]|uniref:lipid-A-disaccharide synthase n=1 Tax=Thiolapillus sp. TaxID=2017437 RepID=UPI003AF912B8